MVKVKVIIGLFSQILGKRKMKYDILKYILNQPAKFLGHMALDTYRSLNENSSFSLCTLPKQRVWHLLKMQLHD